MSVLLTRSQAGYLLGTGKRGITNLARAGRLPSVQCVHGHRSYPLAAVVALAVRRRPGGPITTWKAGRIVVGVAETYRVEYVGHRPGGGIDVVLSATPHDHRSPAYLAFRWDGVWRPLAGLDRDLESAVHRAEHEHRYAGWDSAELAAVLGTLGVA
ncbi:hypothetical protein AB0I81_22440 [Nonomuraea sp. NPDC050404]|uniref:hypothetical protein n=1 Tax=Nonomuraea sp. NPDC050404 TaxID=3155783 RepID=UPI0033BFD11E